MICKKLKDKLFQIMMKTVSVHDINGVRVIAVDNEVFDWGLEEEDFKTAQLITKNDPAMRENYLGNIQKHFVDCFSEFIGRPTTLREINESLKDGWIT